MGGILTSPQGVTSPASIKKSHVGGNRFILEFSGERSLELNLRPVAEKGIGIVRIELPRQQPEAPQDVSGFFPLQPRKFRQPSVLHSEMVSHSTKKDSGAVTQKHIIYLSNGDKIELMVEACHHANGGMVLKYANWQIFGENPENAIELTSPDRKFTGGQRKLTLSNDKSEVQLSIQMDIPRYGRGGAVKILSAEINAAPNPIWLRLGSGETAQGQHVVGHQAIDAEVSLESLEIRISNGDLEATNALAVLALENHQALKLLQEIYVLASEVEFGPRDFGGLSRQRVLTALVSSLQLAMGHGPAAEWISERAREVSASSLAVEPSLETPSQALGSSQASREAETPSFEAKREAVRITEDPATKNGREAAQPSIPPVGTKERLIAEKVFAAYQNLRAPSRQAIVWLFREVLLLHREDEKGLIKSIRRALDEKKLQDAWDGLAEFFENRDGLEIWLFENGYITESQYLSAIKPNRATPTTPEKPGPVARTITSEASASPAKPKTSGPEDFFVSTTNGPAKDSAPARPSRSSPPPRARTSSRTAASGRGTGGATRPGPPP